jgi:molecular chaperone DnaK
VQRIVVTPSTGLSEHDIERLVDEGAEMAEGDQIRRAIADSRNKGEGLLYSSEKAMAEFGGLLPEDERDFLAQELADCRAALEVEDLALVQEAVERLDVAGQRIGELIYAAADQSSNNSDPVG